MKKIYLAISVIFLILLTNLIKNSSKNLETEIFNSFENLSVLTKELDYITLENNYLNSPTRLLELKKSLDDEVYLPITITELKILKIEKNQILINNFNNDE